ncbi:MAG: hypothetical protein K8S16_05475 [Bacteroidales bacterium]|nr:hypothetical protein [Bacteroidales bacterium]
MALETLKEYILSPKPEEQKRHLIYQYFSELFPKSFHEEKRKSDIYIDGQLVVETKSHAVDFLEGFYQALHYRKKGLSFSAVCVIAHKFIALWRTDDIPDFAYKIANNSDPMKPAREMGVINAKKTGKTKKEIIRKKSSFILMPGDFEATLFQPTIIELFEFQKMVLNLEARRLQVDSRNFIETITLTEKFFDKPLDAIHCFYSIVGVWDETSMLAMNDSNEIRAFSTKKGRFSEKIDLHPKHFEVFKKFVEKRYIFTNEGSGFTEDYYFSRFDEVISRLNPEYAKQHGIFFTDINLSKFALWFVHQYFEKKLGEKYVVLDPAGGSGNLVTSWKGNLKHKIVSELQPDLLKTIERRMQLDPEELQAGFTIIPKTSEGVGLNFLDISGEEYLERLENEINKKNLFIDKPLAFLLNPPYKNTDENISKREKVDAQYDVHNSIIEITGTDAGRERYLAFLGQILNICKSQVEKHPGFKPVVMIFTPTSWLIPRPTYVSFREIFDRYFKFENGFIVTGKEFFKLPGKWPLSFSIWTYNYKEKGNKNNVRVRDFNHITKKQISLNWNETLENINKILLSLIRSSKTIKLDNSRGDIRNTLPLIKRISSGKMIQQTRYDYSHAKRKEDYGKLVSGFPLNDKYRHFELKRTCGNPLGQFIGLMDDGTPVRISQDNYQRMSNQPDRIWFRLDLDFKGANKTKISNGAADNRSYCAYDIFSARSTISWFAITKSTIDYYPLWANQFDIWPPKLNEELAPYYYSLCFAFALAENVCVVIKFEADNPMEGAPEVFVDNPLCPANPESFWSTTLDGVIVSYPPLAKQLVKKIKELYTYWNQEFCKGKTIEYVGLQDEPYFRYFSYPDFLTPYSGLVQIRKYATINNKADLVTKFEEISKLSKAVKEEIYRLLVKEFGYFE